MQKQYKNTNSFSLPKNFDNKCLSYTSLLLNYTKTHNITAFKDKNEVYNNINDSVYPLGFLKNMPKSIADIGSGAGFPGLFLALALPKTTVTLYEPLKKKAAFLHLAKSTLRINNLHIKSLKVEEEKNQSYELIVSRAVTDTKVLLELSKNICTKKTKLLLYKGSNVKNELNDLDARIEVVGNRRYVFLPKKDFSEN